MNLNQVTVPVRDVEKSIFFYRQLGLQLIVRALPEYARFLCPAGNATFSVHRVTELPMGNGPWIYFEVEALEKCVSDLLAKGIAIEEMPLEKPWLWTEARLKDPDGNQLILYRAGVNRVNPPWRIEDAD